MPEESVSKQETIEAGGNEGTVSPPAASDDKILAMLETIAGAVGSLAERVAAVESSVPKVVKMRRPTTPSEKKAGTYERPEDLTRSMRLNKGRDGVSGGHQGLLDTAKGVRRLPPDYQPVFAQGDSVTLNPDSHIWGDETRTWKEIIETEFDGEPPTGEVMGVPYISKSWEPKYKVRFEGLTQPGGDGFRESELLPA